MDEENSSKLKFVIVKYYYLFELAAIYGISVYLMRKLIREHQEEIGKQKGRSPYRPEKVDLIFKRIKLPANVRVRRV